jgi:hypothetical protein
LNCCIILSLSRFRFKQLCSSLEFSPPGSSAAGS